MTLRHFCSIACALLLVTGGCSARFTFDPPPMSSVIVDMAREEGRRLKDGRIAFRRATHQEIANRIGTTRETVTRMLKDLERQGLIHVEGKEMVVQPDFERVFD